MQQAPIVGLSQVVSQIQLSHNLAFPMATLLLSLNLVKVMDTRLKLWPLWPLLTHCFLCSGTGAAKRSQPSA
jgi:hypothetical protein